MGVPSVTKTWTISANNRYLFPTGGALLGVMQAFALSIKNFLKTTMAYTVKGSCSAGTGAMDGADRWTLASDVTPRNAGAGGSQAWVVLTDGNGCDLCLSYNSNADDVFRIAYSPGGLYAAAGTPNQQPTAADEVPIWTNANVTIVAATASRDRVWHFWGSSDKKMFRCVLYRVGVPNSCWGLELVSSSVVSPSVHNPAVWGWGYVISPRISSNTGGLLSGGQSPPTNGGGGSVRVTVPTTGTLNAIIGGGGEHFGSVGGQTDNGITSAKPELQGGTGQIWIPVTLIGTATATVSGRLGYRIDWWAAITNSFASLPVEGELYNNKTFLSVGSSIFPWDGVTGAVIK